MMASFDPSISNGSCWASDSVPLSDDYIPCGNVADGSNYACCRGGDNCLSSGACFHLQYYITYVAGCTAEGYDDSAACQDKSLYSNQSWVGLQYCQDRSSWAGCPEDASLVGDHPATPNCKCTDDNILFPAAPILDSIGSLPKTTGGTISWFQGYTPTSAVSTTEHTTPTSASTAAVPSSTTSDFSPVTPDASGLASSSPSASSVSQGGLSVTEKAGIGAAAGVVALLLGGLAALCVFLRKRRTKGPNAPPEQSTAVERTPRPVSELPASLFNFKSELPANEPPSVATNTSLGTPVSPQTQQRYRAYDPRIAPQATGNSNISQDSSATHAVGGLSQNPAVVSPQTTGDPNSPLGAVGIGQAISVDRPVYELEG